MNAKSGQANERLLARMRFRHLQLVAEVERTGSLRAAAQTLHLTQPALSKALKELESILGFALFTRTTRGLASTAQGRIFIHGAHLLIGEMRHVRNEASAAGPEGRAASILRIGAPPFVAMDMLPRVLLHLATREPPVMVRLREERVPQLFSALLAGEVDVLVTIYTPEALAASASNAFLYEKLANQDYAVIAPPAHPLTRTRRVPWAQLATERWVLATKSALIRNVVEEHFLREGLIPPDPAIESTSPVTNVKLVAAGLGLSAVPTSSMREAERAGEVRRIRVYPPIGSSAVGLIYRASAALHPRVSLLREAFGKYATI